MGPTKVAPKGVQPAQTGYVDLFDGPISEGVPFSVHSDESDLSSGTFSNAFSDTLPGQSFDNHPLFRCGGNPIPGADKREPWMRRNALELMGMHGIEAIAKAEPGEKFVVAALMNASLTEMRGVELKEHGYSKADNECLLMVKRTQSLLRFMKVDATGLPDAQANWFESLLFGKTDDTKFIHRGTYVREVTGQRRRNEVAFREFYASLNGLDPTLFTKLHAWVTLDRGRIPYVGVPNKLPDHKVPGLRAEFSARIVGGAAHVSCTDRSLLYGMPSVYMAYFQEPFIRIGDVNTAVEAGVPHEEADDIDSNAILGA